MRALKKKGGPRDLVKDMARYMSAHNEDRLDTRRISKTQGYSNLKK